MIDEWNNRVQVYDANGAYLTTIGEQWGAGRGDMRAPAGLALDEEDEVYVADRENHRIQKFAVGVPGRQQVNVNGFGNRSQGLPTLDALGGKLYAGTWDLAG